MLTQDWAAVGVPTNVDSQHASSQYYAARNAVAAAVIR